MTITPLMPVYPRCGVRPVRGEGCYLISENGDRYLDMAAGIAVNALGHGHPHLVKAIAEQAATLMHVSNLYGSPQGEALAERIVANSFADTVFFTNSGTEAVECAIKTARRYHFANGNPQRNTIITFNNALSDQFQSFFQRKDTFALGVCNGCQMFAELAVLIPGAQDWPRFTDNQSERFEARLSQVQVMDSPSLFFQGMAGCRLPIAVAHGEGYANFAEQGHEDRVLVAMRYVDHHGQPTQAYPFNPNGSPGGLTAVTTPDGRFTAMMPHPERVFRQLQFSWTADSPFQKATDFSPWMRIWRNARRWVD